MVVGSETGLKMLKTDRGVILDVYVKPNSKEFKIITDNNEFIVFCRESPEKGKVNKEIIKELTRLFRKKVEIVAGFTSRQKKILVKAATEEEIIKHMTKTD
jgi:uncharacterized protein (TIGR00251 family)